MTLKRLLVAMSLLIVWQGAGFGQAAEDSDPLPGTLAWRAAQARKQGVRVVTLQEDLAPRPIDLSLDVALKNSTIVRATVQSAKSYVENSYTFVTWYKIKVLETIFRGPSDPRTISFTDLPKSIRPDALLPLGEDELLVLREGGSISVDGVVITTGIDSLGSVSAQESLLLFVGMDNTGTFAKIPLDSGGEYKISVDGKIKPLRGDGGVVYKELLSRIGGRIESLREYLSH